MKKSKYSDNQIMAITEEGEGWDSRAGGRKYSMSSTNF